MFLKSAPEWSPCRQMKPGANSFASTAPPVTPTTGASSMIVVPLRTTVRWRLQSVTLMCRHSSAGFSAATLSPNLPGSAPSLNDRFRAHVSLPVHMQEGHARNFQHAQAESDFESKSVPPRMADSTSAASRTTGCTFSSGS